MRYFRHFTVALIFIASFHLVNSQTFDSYGLDFYNLYEFNPAYIKAKEKLQFDLVGSTSYTAFENHPTAFGLSSLYSTRDYKNNYRISIYNSSMGELGKTDKVFLGYSHSTKLFDKVLFSIGLNTSYMRGKYSYTTIDDDLLKSKDEYLDINTGFSATYKQMEIGINWNKEVWSRNKNNFDEIFEEQGEPIERDLSYIGLLAKYELETDLKLSFIPCIKYVENTTHFSLLTEYDDKFGLGIFYTTRDTQFGRNGNKIMLSGSVTLYERIKLIGFFNPKYSKIYDSNTGYNLLFQLSIMI